MDYQENKSIEKNKTLLQAFKHAIEGIQTVYRQETNMRIHSFLACVALLCGYFFHVSAIEWMFLLVCSCLVLVLEMVNTACELLVDLIVGKTYHETAKKVKDIAAGSVLLAALFSAVVASIIFIPKWLVMWQ